MQSISLTERIRIEFGLIVSNRADRHVLSGIFSRYRPSGAGLERVLSGDGIEGMVRTRIEKIFHATASSWEKGDLYFVVRHREMYRPAQIQNVVVEHLKGVRAIAEYSLNSELVRVLDKASVVLSRPADAKPNSDIPEMMYDCLTDFLLPFRSKHQLAILMEAIYSMANNYFLTTYVLWPAIEEISNVRGNLDSYIDIWSHGIKLEFFDDGRVLAQQ
jgi:hypothetical protein